MRDWLWGHPDFQPAYIAKPWADDEITYLVDAYSRKVAVKDIGLRLGRSNNSVVGKAFRLGLCESPRTYR
jgi:hypothetical protein